MNDLELLRTIEEIRDAIVSRRTVSQEDVISIESLVNSKIITEHTNISKFCSVRDSHNVNLVIESLNSYITENNTSNYLDSVRKRAKSLFKIISRLSYAEPLDRFIHGYNESKAYNESGNLLPIKSLSINEFVTSVLSTIRHIGGVEGDMTPFFKDQGEGKNKVRIYLPRLVLNNVIKGFEDSGLYADGNDEMVSKYLSCFDVNNRSFTPSLYVVEKTIVDIYSILSKEEIVFNFYNPEIDNDISVMEVIDTYNKLLYYIQSNKDLTRSVLSTLDDISRYGRSEKLCYYNERMEFFNSLTKGDSSEYDERNSVYYMLSLLFGNILNSFTLACYKDEIVRSNGLLGSEVLNSVCAVNDSND